MGKLSIKNYLTLMITCLAFSCGYDNHRNVQVNKYSGSGKMELTIRVPFYNLFNDSERPYSFQQKIETLKSLERKNRLTIDQLIDWWKVNLPDYNILNSVPLEVREEFIDPENEAESWRECIKVMQTKVCDRTMKIIKNRLTANGLMNNEIERTKFDLIRVRVQDLKTNTGLAKKLTRQGKLMFYETYENEEVYGYLVELNEKLKGSKAVIEAMAQEKDIPEKKDTSIMTDLEKLLSNDKQESEQFEIKPLFDLMSPAYYNDGSGQSFLTKGSCIGYVGLNDLDSVFNMLNRSISDFRINVRFFVQKEPLKTESGPVYRIHAIQPSKYIEGGCVKSARSSVGLDGKPEILITFSSFCSKKWERMTEQNIGRSIAICIDDSVISAPTIHSIISGGGTSISGKYSQEEVMDIANMLSNDPMPFVFLEEENYID